MHTIAGVAISDGLSAGEVAAAGVLVGAAVLLLSVTRTMEYINRFIPLALVRGIQLGVGLGLFRRAFTDGYIFATPWSAWDGPAAACIAAVLLLIATVRARPPLAPIVAASRQATAYVSPADASTAKPQLPRRAHRLLRYSRPRRGRAPRRAEQAHHWAVPAAAGSNCSLPRHGGAPTLSLSPSLQITPTWAEWHRASVAAFLPQLPLTTLNSVVAVRWAEFRGSLAPCARLVDATQLTHARTRPLACPRSQLARDLYPSTPEHPAPVTRTALSVGILNAAFCWLGAVPSCHGSGGLAAQHALGARSSVSMLFLGTIRVVFALLFGSSMLSLVAVFPSTVLGAMLCVAGVQLAACAFDMESEADVMVLLATAGGTIALGGTGPGFLVGCATAATLYAVHTITPQAADARVRPTTDSAAEEPQPRRIPFWVFFTTGSSMLEEKRVVRSARQGPESGLLAYSAVEAATDE